MTGNMLLAELRNCIFLMAVALAFGLWPASLAAQAQPPRPVLVQAFLEIELLDSSCWRYVTAFGIVEYENICSADSRIALVKGNGKPASYAIPPQGNSSSWAGTRSIFSGSREGGKNRAVRAHGTAGELPAPEILLPEASSKGS